MSNIKLQIQTLKDTIRHPYVWPGGYPRYIVLSDGEMICPICARKFWDQILFALKYQPTNDQWYPIGQEIVWEGTHFCIQCMKELETAYGESTDGK